MNTPIDAWFVRAGSGETKGPYSAEKIRDYARRGKLVPAHPISSDGSNWTTAGSHTWLFHANGAVVDTAVANRDEPEELEIGAFEVEVKFSVTRNGIRSSFRPLKDLVHLANSGKITAFDEITESAGGLVVPRGYARDQPWFPGYTPKGLASTDAREPTARAVAVPKPSRTPQTWGSIAGQLIAVLAVLVISWFAIANSAWRSQQLAERGYGLELRRLDRSVEWASTTQAVLAQEARASAEQAATFSRIAARFRDKERLSAAAQQAFVDNRWVGRQLLPRSQASLAAGEVQTAAVYAWLAAEKECPDPNVVSYLIEKWGMERLTGELSAAAYERATAELIDRAQRMKGIAQAMKLRLDQASATEKLAMDRYFESANALQNIPIFQQKYDESKAVVDELLQDFEKAKVPMQLLWRREEDARRAASEAVRAQTDVDVASEQLQASKHFFRWMAWSALGAGVVVGAALLRFIPALKRQLSQLSPKLATSSEAIGSEAHATGAESASKYGSLMRVFSRWQTGAVVLGGAMLLVTSYTLFWALGRSSTKSEFNQALCVEAAKLCTAETGRDRAEIPQQLDQLLIRFARQDYPLEPSTKEAEFNLRERQSIVCWANRRLELDELSYAHATPLSPQDEELIVAIEAPTKRQSAHGKVPEWAEVIAWDPDPKVVTDENCAKRILESGLPWHVRDKRSNIELLLVPAGKFMMGASPDDGQAPVNERPVHEVALGLSFYLGRTEVTQAQWSAEMAGNPSEFNSFAESHSLPVENISWDMIQTFCTRSGCRLPTEAEWEYACRGGQSEPRSAPLECVGWYRRTEQWRTYSVASKEPNAWGFFDMIGNVAEWCADPARVFSAVPCKDPMGPPNGENRIVRGGPFGALFVGSSNGERASDRFERAPNVGTPFFGFRIARNP
ncbi:MAG: hypothetical protein EXS10_08120 [Phycisphaerales bacterium]|nr:hypothetical protein [Phycisphaerales bacterium]